MARRSSCVLCRGLCSRKWGGELLHHAITRPAEGPSGNPSLVFFQDVRELDAETLCLLRIDNWRLYSVVLGKAAADALVTAIVARLDLWLGGQGLVWQCGGILAFRLPEGGSRPLGHDGVALADLLDELRAMPVALQDRSNAGDLSLYPALSCAFARGSLDEDEFERSVALAFAPEPVLTGALRIEALRTRFAAARARSGHLLQPLLEGDFSLRLRPILRNDELRSPLCSEAVDILGPEGAFHELCALYADLEVLGLADILAHALVREAVMRLAADPDAVILVPLIAGTVRADPAWTDLFGRLSRRRDLGCRLILEVTGDASRLPAGELVGFCAAARGAGLKIALGAFGAGPAAIRQLVSLAPDVVRIAPLFARRAAGSPRQTEVLHALIVLVRSLVSCRIVVDGVDCDAALEAAHRAGATWMAGAIVGVPSARSALHDRARSTSPWGSAQFHRAPSSVGANAGGSGFDAALAEAVAFATTGPVDWTRVTAWSVMMLVGIGFWTALGIRILGPW